MSRPVEIDVVIAPDGTVHCEVRGAKGRRCLAWRDVVAGALGRVVREEPTPERWEAEEVGVAACEVRERRR